jgi:hypothetical protein
LTSSTQNHYQHFQSRQLFLFKAVDNYALWRGLLVGDDLVEKRCVCAGSHSSIRRFGLAEPLGKHFRIKKKKPPSVCGNLELRGLRRALAVVVAASTGIFNRTDSYLC